MKRINSSSPIEGPEVASSEAQPVEHHWCWLALLAVLFALHGWQTIRLFPSWRAMVDDQPVISVDHAIHLYHGYLGARFLREHGTSWGYDPFFMAGYPKTPVYDSSSGPAELFELLAGGEYSPRAYKIGTAVLVGIVVVVLTGAAWAYGGGLTASAAVAGWALCYWWVGFPDVLVRTGLVAFVWSSTVAVLVPGLLLRWGQRPSVGSWIALSLGAAAGVQGHSIFPLMIFAPMVVGYLALSMRRVDESRLGRTRRGWRWHAATWGALGAALAVTSFWWWPLLRFLPLKTGSDLFMKAEYWSFCVQYYQYYEGRVPLLLLFFGVIGLVRMWRCGRKVQVTMLAAQIGLLSGLTFAGSMWGVTRNLEPLRFQVPLNLAWCIAAGDGLCGVVTALNPLAWAGSRGTKLRWVGAVAFTGMILLVTTPATWWWSGGVAGAASRPPSTWRFTWDRLRFARPLGVGLRPEMVQLVAWIRTNTDPSARILFEDQLRLLENNDPGCPESLHWTPLLPLLTGREFIGGLYHLAFIPHQVAAFGDWNLAGRNIRSWSPEQLRAFCDQYNIGWVITWSRASPRKDRGRPLATDVFASTPFCEIVSQLPRHTIIPDENVYTIFRVNREHSFFARGRGRLERADYNRIELADLEPEAGDLVLRYHWQDGFRTEPPLPIERAVMPGDPVGFIRIRIEKPVDRLLLWNSYR